MDRNKTEQIEKIADAVGVKDKTNIIDVLLDEDNKDPIVLFDAKTNEKFSFEQIAVIPYNDKIYCVLKPIEKMADVADDEAIVFYVDETDPDMPLLKPERDEKIAIEVFDEYYNLLDESAKEDKE